ncbi:hypothetical protein BDV93DRAFT_524359 [Ceratobasidium sp. AG-I]|nr:hypothetical protein BDV93DRAFT_524359 [Ceratobasidium sp. AG-I]
MASLQSHTVEQATETHRSSRRMPAHWLCGIGEGFFEVGKERDEGQRSGADMLVPASHTQQLPLDQSSYRHTHSVQPARHPAMVMVVAVEHAQEADRIRGGCFPCKNGKVVPSLAADRTPSLQPDMPRPVRTMQLVPDAAQKGSGLLTVPESTPRPKLPSVTEGPTEGPTSTGPTSSRHASRPSQLPNTSTEAATARPRQRFASEAMPKRPEEAADKRKRTMSHK